MTSLSGRKRRSHGPAILRTLRSATLLALTVPAYAMLAYVVLPGVNEVPAGFPAAVLWRFRVASLGIQVVLWTTLGLVFGALTERQEAVALAQEASLRVGAATSGV